MKKKYSILFLFLKQKHKIHFVQPDKVSEICFLLIIRWGESGKAI